jgi:hypothetical protein
MATAILPCQNLTFQITLKEIGIFFCINTLMFALKWCAHVSFSKKLFWKQIGMILLLDYY